MTLEKFARKALKQVIFILLAAGIAHVILSYFIPVRELMALMREGPREHMTAFLWALFGTLVTYFNFAWFREQTCLIVCPYGRLQSALIDDSTIIIGYDETRGEPRHKRKDEGGDCIDCFRCVEVCPTGIDIRNGLQLECIGCANCIDACDDVMEKMGKPRGLVRYDSLEGLSGRRRRFLRPRVYIYAVAGLVGLAVATGAIANRAPFQVNALRAPGTPFVLEEASIRNVYNLHLQNKTTEARSYRIERQPAPAGYDANVSLIIPQAEVRVGGLSDALVPIIAAAPREDYRGPFDLVFVVTELGSGYDREVRVRFRGP